eukprot:364211-Prorocentrum_minimum.AAC.1
MLTLRGVLLLRLEVCRFSTRGPLGFERGRVSGVLSAPSPLLAQEDPEGVEESAEPGQLARLQRFTNDGREENGELTRDRAKLVAQVANLDQVVNDKQ